MPSLGEATGHILIVDDDSMACDMLDRRLKRKGFKSSIAMGGRKAIDQIPNNTFDIILLDLNMPDIDGLAVLRMIRETYSKAELPVIMVTGHSEDEKIVHALQQGANDFLTKPYSFNIMLARIRSQLACRFAYVALRESEQRYALAMQGANDGLWDWNLTDDTIYFSPQWKAMLGYRETEIDNQFSSWFDCVHLEDQKQLKEDIQQHLEGQSLAFQGEYRVRHKNGSYRWMMYKGIAVRNASNEPMRLLGSQRDITENKIKDPLTGLSNRLLFLHRLKFSFERKKRNPQYKFAVLFLDLDQFKMINDSLGHAVGDRLLQEAAKRLESSVRSTDMVAKLDSPHVIARMGGDEFTILLEDLRLPKDSITIAERIQQILQKPFQLDGREVFVSTSIGIALCEGQLEYQKPEEMLRDADTAMYRAKAKGRGRYELFDKEMHTRAMERLELETELRRAVEEQQFHVYYQPLIELSTQRIKGFEALVRWQHPTKGIVSPGVFIPVAEESGLITAIGMWVFEESCRQLKQWHDLGFEHLDININLSRKQFFATHLSKECKQILERTKIDPKHVVFEITESTVMDNQGRESKMLQELKHLGLRLSMDDFGTGYSSLSLLRQLPFDSLKLDRSFIDKMDTDPKEAAMVRHIIAIAYECGLDVTAEGVERVKQLQLLCEMKCTQAQGYYFSRPVPGAEATQLLRKPIQTCPNCTQSEGTALPESTSLRA